MNDLPVEAMSLSKFIRRTIEEAQSSGVYVQRRIDSVTTPWLFPHPVGHVKGIQIEDEALLQHINHRARCYGREEDLVDVVFAHVCSINRQSICILLVWEEGETTRHTSVSYPLCVPVW